MIAGNALTVPQIVVCVGRLVLVSFLCFLEKLFALELDVVKAFNCVFLIVVSVYCGGKKLCPCKLST